MSRIFNRLISILVVLLCSGCSHAPLSRLPSSPPTTSAQSTPEQNQSTSPATEIIASQTTFSGAQQQIREIGTGNYLAEANQAPAITGEHAAGDITLNFQGTDLREFAKVILSDMLKENFTIDPEVSGSVTIDTPHPVRRVDLLPILEEILAINGATIIQSAGGMYRVLPLAQAGAGNVAPTTIDRGGSDGYSIRIIPLTYVAAQEMQKILEPYVADSNNLRIDTKRNLVIANGTRQELDMIQETIRIFDVDWMRGMSMGLYPLTFVDPKSLKAELDTIIGAMEAEPGKEMLGGMVRAVPLERLNSMLLISSTPAALREVEIWVHRLDKPGEKVGKRLYVYQVQNAKATDLADILGQIFTGSKGTTPQRKAPELAPGQKPVDIGTETGAPATQPARPTPGTVAGGGEGISLPGSDAIEVIADDIHNALVVLATPQDYTMVETAIKKLDVVPLQVLIEASIMEVTLRDDLSYGVEWFFKNSLQGGIKKGQGVLDLGNAGIQALAPGFSYTVIDSAANVRVALTALQNESDVNVLSSPSLMVLDNQTATINVGDEIPVPARQTVSNLVPNSPTVNEIQYRKTGVTLEVTPRVNSGGLVSMEVKQEVSAAVTTTTSDLNAPTIQNRQIKSVVAINSGETIILGGLIQNSKTSSTGGLPVIHKIPILGKLFGKTSNDKHRTELLVLITPRVIGGKDDARGITEEFRRKLRGITPIANGRPNNS